MNVARPTPIGVHFNRRLRHVSQPPAANNHQSNIDNIVQPTPAFHPHDFWIRFNLLNLPFLATVDAALVVVVVGVFVATVLSSLFVPFLFVGVP